MDPEFTITSSIVGPSTVTRWGTDRTALFSRGTHHAVPESESGRMLLIGHFHVRAKIDGEWMRLRTEF